MHNSLGLGNLGLNTFSIIDALIPHKRNLVFKRDKITSVKQWMQARKSCYDLLVFDEQTLSGQAMLGKLIKDAIDSGFLNEEFWYLTDDQLLNKLIDFPLGKDVIKRLTVGNTYAALGIYWLDYDDQIVDWLNSNGNRKSMSDQLSSDLKIPCLVYYFQDKGAFSKKLNVMVGDSIENIESTSIGEDSHSIIIGIFTSSQDTHAISSSKKQVSQLFDSLLPSKPSRRNLPVVRSYFGINYQKEFFI
jgi:HD superfamily phosphohydrolase